jgi:hypothetical protein
MTQVLPSELAPRPEISNYELHTRMQQRVFEAYGGEESTPEHLQALTPTVLTVQSRDLLGRRMFPKDHPNERDSKVEALFAAGNAAIFDPVQAYHEVDGRLLEVPNQSFAVLGFWGSHNGDVTRKDYRSGINAHLPIIAQYSQQLSVKDPQYAADVTRVLDLRAELASLDRSSQYAEYTRIVKQIAEIQSLYHRPEREYKLRILVDLFDNSFASLPALTDTGSEIQHIAKDYLIKLNGEPVVGGNGIFVRTLVNMIGRTVQMTYDTRLVTGLNKAQA